MSTKPPMRRLSLSLHSVKGKTIIAKRLRRLQRMLKMTQAELAGALGVPLRTMVGWISFERTPRKEAQRRIELLEQSAGLYDRRAPKDQFHFTGKYDGAKNVE